MNLYHKGDFTTVVEPFGGSAKFLLNIEQWTLYGKKVIVYNDRDKRLVDIFLALRDNKDEFIRKFSYVLTSRYLFEEYQKDSDDIVENGFRQLYTLLCGYSGDDESFIVTTTPERVLNWDRIIYNIDNVIYPIIKNWIIECDDFISVIKRWDSPNTFFYLDPPYLDKSFYRYNFTKDAFRILYNTLIGIKGKYVLSHDANDDILSIFGEPQMRKQYTNIINAEGVDGTREEWFYTNLKL